MSVIVLESVRLARGLPLPVFRSPAAPIPSVAPRAVGQVVKVVEGMFIGVEGRVMAISSDDIMTLYVPGFPGRAKVPRTSARVVGATADPYAWVRVGTKAWIDGYSEPGMIVKVEPTKAVVQISRGCIPVRLHELSETTPTGPMVA
jgi:hypothetical protein